MNEEERLEKEIVCGRCGNSHLIKEGCYLSLSRYMCTLDGRVKFGDEHCSEWIPLGASVNP